jgi:8-oxo-dGTP diphosphatase
MSSAAPEPRTTTDRTIPGPAAVPDPGAVDPAHALGPRAAVKAVIVRDGAVLMNRSSDGSHEIFDLPGGGQEWGETQQEALVRECEEEIGARVKVFGIACVYEFLTTVDAFHPEPIPFAHQLNVAYWCGLPRGVEPDPSAATGADDFQVGTAWLRIDELDVYDVRPRALADWLRADPSIRPVTLGQVDLGPAAG